MMNNENNLFLTIIYQGITKKVNFTDEEYICLNDLAKFFPQKRLDHWLSNSSTRDFISVVENQLNMNYDTRNIGYHKSAIFTIKGKGKKQGTYAHELVALEFLSWLSPEFKVLVFSQWNTWRKQQATPQQTNILTLDALQEMMKGWMKKNDG